MFKPKKIICLIKTDRFKYTCKNIHLDKQEHEINNTYRFNKGVPYLIKNKEDYDELVSLDMFEDFKEEVKETAKEKRDREKAEKEAEEAKKAEEEQEAEESSEDNSDEIQEAE